MEGALEKWKNPFHRWKVRWFRLNVESMTADYYLTESEMLQAGVANNPQPHNSINLANGSLGHEKNYFFIHQENGPKIYLRAKTQTEQRIWCQAFNRLFEGGRDETSSNVQKVDARHGAEEDRIFDYDSNLAEMDQIRSGSSSIMNESSTATASAKNRTMQTETIKKLEEDLKEAKRICDSIIYDLLRRDEQLSKLADKADKLQYQSNPFFKNAHRLHAKFSWENAIFNCLFFIPYFMTYFAMAWAIGVGWAFFIISILLGIWLFISEFMLFLTLSVHLIFSLFLRYIFSSKENVLGANSYKSGMQMAMPMTTMMPGGHYHYHQCNCNCNSGDGNGGNSMWFLIIINLIGVMVFLYPKFKRFVLSPSASI